MRDQALNILGFSWLTGPIFEKELRVSSRRRRNYVLRFVYLAILLVSLVLVWLESVRYGNSSLYAASRMGMAGQSIVMFIVWFQFCAAQLVAIVALSTSIGDEINSRTLAALMTTPINSFQVVTGKLLSKLLQILLLMAISLPLLAIVRVLGGVPWGFVVSSLLITLVCVLFVGLLSLFFSIFCRRAYVVMLANLLTIGVLFGLLPLITAYMCMEVFDVSDRIFFRWLTAFNPYVLLALETERMMTSFRAGIPQSFLPGCLVGMLAGCGALFMLSVAMVRKVALLQATGQLGKRKTSKAQMKLNEVLGGEYETSVPISAGPVRRVVGPPVLWREMVRPVFGQHKKWFLILIGGAVLLLLATYLMAAAEGALDDEDCHMVFAAIMLILGILFAIILPATCISSEKESRTWPLLLSTTLGEPQILLGKFVGALRRVLPAFGFLIGHMVVFCTFGIINPIAVPQMGLIVTWVSVFLAGTGLYFSTCFKHTTTAVIMNFALALTMWALLPLLLVMICEITRSGDDLVEAYMNANPVFQAVCIMDATAQGGWEIRHYQWCNFRMGAIASTIFLLNMAAFHMFIGFLFAWRAKCRMRRRII